MKIFKSNKTIKSELRWYLLGLIVLLVFFYTILLEEYFIRGIDIATKIDFEIIGYDYNLKRNKNPNTPLPTQAYLYTYIDWSTAPKIFKNLFPVSNHKNNKLISIEKYEKENNELTQFVFMRYLLSDNGYLYLVGKYPPEMLNEQQTNEFENTILITFPLALLFIAAAVLLIYHLGRRIGRSSDALNAWAEQLSLESLNQEKPDFHYAELNGVADRLQNAFLRIGSLLEKEHLFLRFTSHELRTPLAITQANVEYLEKIGIQQCYEKQITRIKRANASMQDITEALLWLSRESETIPKNDLILINDVLENIINDHRYLLINKNVEVELYKCVNKINVPIVLFRIIISNLMRNAFLYTSDGIVIISMEKNTILLRNQNSNLKDNPEQEKDYGFGLGLVLVERLTNKLGWKFNYQLISGGRIVSIKII
ncbi:MAG: sensor histidine kinase [Thiohalomonadales bacterium]